MNLIVIADTGPIHYLVLSDLAELLPRLYGAVIIPAAVHRELLHPHAPASVRSWASALPPWAEVRCAAHPAQFGALGAGEGEAIALALETKARLLLIDDTIGRRIAKQNAIPVQGTLGFLETAARRNLISLAPALKRLQTTGIYLAPDIINAALGRDRQNRPLSGSQS